MKKIISLLCILVIIASVTVMPMQTNAAGISDNLVAHWDFAGDDLAQQLSDKAPAGNSADNLTLAGNVIINNGVATVPKEGGSYLYATNQSDLNSYTQFTTVMKFKASGTATGFADFISKDSSYLYRAFINNTKSTTTEYGLDCRLKGAIGTSWSLPGTGKFAVSEDIYFALSAVLDTTAKNVTLISYMSTDGINFLNSTTKTYALTDSILGTVTDYSANPLLGALFLGKNAGANRDKDMGVSFEIDDVRMYNKALNITEISSVYQNTAPTASSVFDFLGFSIRTEDPQGLRAKFEVSKNVLNATKEANGYELVEYGAVLTQRESYDASEGAAGAQLKLGMSHGERNNTGKMKIWQSGQYFGNIYEQTENGNVFTSVLVNISNTNLSKAYAFRAYCIVETAAGESLTIYSDVSEASIYDIAQLVLADPGNGLSAEQITYIQTNIIDIVNSAS